MFTTAPTGRAGYEAATSTSFTYASETLLTTEVTEVEGDSTTYYNIGDGTDTLVLSVPADVAATVGDAYVVGVTLDGMVFRTAPTLVAAAGVGSPEFSLVSGGAKEKVGVWMLTAGGLSADEDAGSVLNLTASYAVSEGGGSVTLTTTNRTLAELNIPGVSGIRTYGPSNVIKVAPALRERPMASNLTASVESGFRKFATEDGGLVTVGHVGSISIDYPRALDPAELLDPAERHRSASSGDGIGSLTAILVGGQTTVGATTTANSSVSFMGDFSFASKVFVHEDDDCGAEDPDNAGTGLGDDTDLESAETDIRIPDGEGDDAVVTGTTMPVNIDPSPQNDTDSFHAFQAYLCIMVQGDDTDDMEAPRIPDTGAYTVTGSYKALENAAFGPTGMQRTLGEIDRDGTTVHIPFMTTYEGYNQRIVMSNRSAADAVYEVTFRPEAGVTATAKDAAMGVLRGNSTVTMRSTDLVDLSGGARTAATIVVEAGKGDIDVTSVTVNKKSRDTDTVVHESE